jgi:hypothetical protein
VSVPPVEPPLIERADVLPTVADVALLLRSRTVGYLPQSSGLGGDTGPGDWTTFDDTTRPTATEVEQVVEVACDEVLGQLPAAVDVRLWPTVKRAIAVRAAAIIEQSFFRETATDLSAAYATSMSALQTAVPGEVAIASGRSLREQDVEATLEGIPLLPAA